MTRGRNRNTAHLVADTLEEARAHWIEVFSRDRADLGPGHAARPPPRKPSSATDPRLRTTRALQAAALRDPAPLRADHP